MLNIAPILAVEWSAEPGLEMKSVYNDNIWMSVDEKNSIFDIRVKPNMKINRESESSLVSLDTAWSQKKYISNDAEMRGLFSTHLQVTKEYAKQFIQLNTAYIERSTIGSETSGVDRLLVEIVKTEKNLQPTWRTIWSPHLYWDLSVNYSMVNFEKSAQQWNDYRYYSPSINAFYQMNENTQGSVALGASRYALQDIDYTVDSLFLRSGVKRELNENSQAGLVLGAQQVHRKRGEITPDNSNQLTFTLNADYALKLVKGKVYFDISRQLTPTALGDIQFNDRAKLSGNYRWSERGSTQLSVVGEKRKNTGNNSTVNGRKLFVVRLKIQWQFEENWSAHLAYQWLTNKYENRSEWANSHQVTLSTRYTWDKAVLTH